ncbi:uncharacterized protein LTR77_003923 [Saxophila tyrrhenica]|uniref:Uncharacterized protein n=1 Tax=Saxophila tyrrhenica TaxID=1690608 RepID=A0AAV9PFQ0_9PEZI|nr:hypothetical protein LTR77_003923 [Saxophila tyrrhenica]
MLTAPPKLRYVAEGDGKVFRYRAAGPDEVSGAETDLETIPYVGTSTSQSAMDLDRNIARQGLVMACPRATEQMTADDGTRYYWPGLSVIKAVRKFLGCRESRWFWLRDEPVAYDQAEGLVVDLRDGSYELLPANRARALIEVPAPELPGYEVVVKRPVCQEWYVTLCRHVDEGESECTRSTYSSNNGERSG